MSKKANEEGWWSFLDLCLRMKTREKLNEFFEFILTHEERSDLAGRIALIKALLEGEHSQREISELLGVSIAKITRGSNVLKQVDDSFKQFLTNQLVE